MTTQSNNNSKQLAFGVFVAFYNDKIQNIAFMNVNQSTPEGIELLNKLRVTHKRIGTVHANDLFVKVHKGFASNDFPEGKQYGVSEQGRWIPFEDASLKKIFLMARVKTDDFIIARDGSGNAIVDPHTKQPLIAQACSINYMEMVPADDKNRIEDNLRKRLALPCAIFSTDENITFTFYRSEDQKVFLRPGKYLNKEINTNSAKPAAEVKNEVAKPEYAGMHDMAASMHDDLPF